MKKVILLFVILFSLCSYSQKQYQQTNTGESVVYSNWQISNDGCWNCSSFFWLVSKNKYPDNYGYYTYNVWFYSNGYYSNGDWASVYVWGIKLYVDNYIIADNVWVTFKEPFSLSNLSFRTKNTKPIIYLTWMGHKI